MVKADDARQIVKLRRTAEMAAAAVAKAGW